MGLSRKEQVRSKRGLNRMGQGPSKLEQSKRVQNMKERSKRGPSRRELELSMPGLRKLELHSWLGVRR